MTVYSDRHDRNHAFESGISVNHVTKGPGMGDGGIQFRIF